MPTKKALTNRRDPDQTASEEAVLSGSSLFAILKNILQIQALIINILFANRRTIVFGVWEHLPYLDRFQMKHLQEAGVKEMYSGAVMPSTVNSMTAYLG